MLSDRPRFDLFTRKLLDEERRIQEALSKADWPREVAGIASGLRRKVINLPATRTTLELDYLLQLSMLYASLSATLKIRERRDEEQHVEVKADFAQVDLLSKRVLMKSSFFYPASCFFRHPTLMPELADASNRPLIGMTGVAMLLGRSIVCNKLQECAPYIPLEDFDTLSACCLTLLPFNPSTPLDCSDPSTLSGATLENWEDFEPLSQAVLGLECGSGDLDSELVAELLNDRKFKSFLEHLNLRLAEYQKDRRIYQALRTCTTLLELSQHNLSGRRALRVLLREVSEMCGGADVTLHLKDMFGAEDASRSVRLVTGVGPRMRPFLVNDRYGEGLVGEVVRSGKAAELDEGAIATIIETERRFIGEKKRFPPENRYRQLLPGTRLNLVLPIKSLRRTIGALNIEWSDPPLAEVEYLELKTMLSRVVVLLSLVVDLLDDERNEVLSRNMTRHDGQRQTQMAHRQSLAFYGGEITRKIDAAQRPSELKDYAFLQPIIEVVGYLLAPDTSHRIVTALHRHVPEQHVLEIVCEPHGFSGDVSREERQFDLGSDLTSVVPLCGLTGFPIFGRVEKNQSLRPHSLCKKLAPADVRECFREPISYIPVTNTESVFEVAVPLGAGDRLLGVVDYELLQVDEARHLSPFTGSDLRRFLDWARLISFCILYGEDAVSRLKGLIGGNERLWSGYGKFRRICLQILANVPLDSSVLIPIVSEYAAAFRPVEVELRPQLPSLDEQAAYERAKGKQVGAGELWLRGRYMGDLKVLPKAEDPLSLAPAPLFGWESLDTGTGILLRRLLQGFFTAALGMEEMATPDGGLFQAKMKTAGRWLREGELEFIASMEGTSPFESIRAIMQRLHEALLRAFNPAQERSEFGWFIFLVETQEDGNTVFRSNVRGKRWALMPTVEMDDLVEAIRMDENHMEALVRLIGRSRSDANLEAWVRRRFGSELTDANIQDVVYEVLVDRDYPYPMDDEISPPSITVHTARRRQPLVVPDLNRSPYRSRRQTRWFFRDASYTLISMPVMFAEECLGIIQFFRRRDRVDDLKFFKTADASVAAGIRTYVEGLLRLTLERVSLAEREVTSEGLSPSEQEAARFVREKLGRGARDIFLECHFSTRGEWVKNIFVPAVTGENANADEVRELRNLAEDESALRELAQEKRLFIIVDALDSVEMGEGNGLRKLHGIFRTLRGSGASLITLSPPLAVEGRREAEERFYQVLSSAEVRYLQRVNSAELRDSVRETIASAFTDVDSLICRRREEGLGWLGELRKGSREEGFGTNNDGIRRWLSTKSIRLLPRWMTW